MGARGARRSPLVQTYTVAIDDGHGGTASQLVTVTINGTNDAAIVTGERQGRWSKPAASQRHPGTPTDSGNLDSTDVDNPPDSWQAVVTPTASTGGYGTYELTAAGVWIYTLDNNQCSRAGAQRRRHARRHLHGLHHRRHRAGGVDHDHRRQRRAGRGGGRQCRRCGDREVIRASFPGDPSATGNVLTNDTDVDTGDTRTVIRGQRLGAECRQAAGRPLRHAHALGRRHWSYALDNADPDTNALAQGQVVTDVFTYTMSDANGATSTAALTITITGTNDAPVVTGAVDTGTVTEGVAAGDGRRTARSTSATSISPIPRDSGRSRAAGGYLGTFVGGRDQRSPATASGRHLAVRGQQRAAAVAQCRRRAGADPTRS